MPEDQSQLFRARVEIQSDSGLVRAPRPTRPEGLTINPESFDLKKDFLDDFAGVTPVEPGAVEVAKESEGFTVEDVEVGALDDALRRIHWQQTDQQVRDQIDEARRLMEEGDFSGALVVLEESRSVAPTDATISYLIGFCYFQLGNFQSAYIELEAAVDHAPDAESLAAAAMLRAACLREIVTKVATKVTELKKRGRSKEALALVEENLRQYPSSITLLYQRCELLLRLGLAEQAKRAAQEAINGSGEENAPLFRRMFEQATLMEYRPLLEPVRQALRADDAPKATKLLKSAHSTLKGQQFYEAVCTYAREKGGRQSSGMLSIFSRSGKQAVSIPDDQLQKLLRWLVSEELDAAHDSFDQSDYTGAITRLKQASYIDSRCSHVNYLHGLSLYRAFLLLLNNEDQAIDLEKCAKDLKAAGGYVRDAAADPALADRSRELGAAITGYYEQVRQLLSEFARRAQEARAITDLLTKYNNCLDRLEKVGIRTTAEWQSTREQMSRFRQQAVTLSSSCSEEQGREFLQKLVEALDRNLQAIDRIKQEVQQYSLLHECLIDYETLMHEFQAGLITTYYDLHSAKMRLQQLLNKLAKARVALGYDPAADVRQHSTRDYVNNWRPGAKLSSSVGRTRPANVDEHMWDLALKLETMLLENLKVLESPPRY